MIAVRSTGSLPPLISWQSHKLTITAGTSWICFAENKARHLFRINSREQLANLCAALSAAIAADGPATERQIWERSQPCELGVRGCVDRALLQACNGIWLKLCRSDGQAIPTNYHVTPEVAAEIVAWFTGRDADQHVLTDNSALTLVAERGVGETILVATRKKSSRVELCLPLTGELAEGFYQTVFSVVSTTDQERSAGFDCNGLRFSLNQQPAGVVLVIAAPSTTLMFTIPKVQLALLALRFAA